jgi:hypothetical protein
MGVISPSMRKKLLLFSLSLCHTIFSKFLADANTAAALFIQLCNYQEPPTTYFTEFETAIPMEIQLEAILELDNI